MSVKVDVIFKNILLLIISGEYLVDIMGKDHKSMWHISKYEMPMLGGISFFEMPHKILHFEIPANTIRKILEVFVCSNICGLSRYSINVINLMTYKHFTQHALSRSHGLYN
jgi:hypothetical protein